MVTPSNPRLYIRRCKDRLNFRTGEKVHDSLVVLLAGNQQDALYVTAMSGLLKSGVSKE
jgi:hypothetical protein